MTTYIDTHVHLYDEAYDADFEEVTERMKQAGVIRCVLPAIDSTYFERQEQCVARCGGFAVQAMGLHPTSVGKNWREELDFALDKLYDGNRGGRGEKKYVAVGEIGLDGYWSREFMGEQAVVLQEQLKAASELDLPVIIHLREATGELFDVLDKMKGLPVRGVFHAFSGSAETFGRIQKYGRFMVGIGGVVTYKNAGVARALENIPLENIILETDAPWLTPVPFRGKRNESSYIKYIAGEVARIKGVSAEEIACITTRNACELFGI